MRRYRGAPLTPLGMSKIPMLTTAEPEFPLHSSVLYSQVALRARFVGEFERSGWKRFSTGIIGPRIPCRTRPRADGRTRLSRKREVHARLADAIGKHGRRRALHLQRKALTTESGCMEGFRILSGQRVYPAFGVAN